MSDEVENDHHGMGDDIESYMNDTSHVDDVAHLISPPNEPEPVVSSPSISFKVKSNDDIFAQMESKDAAAKKIQDIAAKKKERTEAKKIVEEKRTVKQHDTAARKIQDIASKKKERLEAQKITNELREKRSSQLAKSEESHVEAAPVEDHKHEAAKKIQDIANKKRERLEAQKITNELRQQKASKQHDATAEPAQSNNNDHHKHEAAKKIQDIATKKKERLEAQKITNELRQAKAVKHETSESTTHDEHSNSSSNGHDHHKHEAAKKIQDIATKKKERLEAQRIAAELREKKSKQDDNKAIESSHEDNNHDHKQEAAKKIQDIATKKKERLEAQRIANELRQQRDSKISPPITTTDSKSTKSSKFVDNKRQAVTDNLLKMESKSIKETDLFNIEDEDEQYLKDFKPDDLKIKIQDSFKTPAEHLKKKSNSAKSTDHEISPIGSKGSGNNSVRSVYSDGGGSSRNLDNEIKNKQRQESNKLRFDKAVRRSSIKNHNSLMAPDVDHDDHDGEFSFDLKSNFGISATNLLQNLAISPHPPVEDKPVDIDGVAPPLSGRKKSLRVIEPAPSSSATATEDIDGAGTTTETTTSMSSKMKPIRRKSKRAIESSEKENEEILPPKEENPEISITEGEKPPKLKISKSARVRSVGSNLKAEEDVVPLKDASEHHKSSNSRLMSVDDIASPNSSMVVAIAGEGIVANKKQPKQKIKLPDIIQPDKKSHISDSASERKHSIAEISGRGGGEVEEYKGEKKKRPLYLRMIAKAHRKQQQEEIQRAEKYNQFKAAKQMNTPSRAEIREHMAKYDEMMKLKQDLGNAALASKIKPFKRKGDNRYLPPLFSPSKANIDGESLADNAIVDENGDLSDRKSPVKEKYPISKLRQKLMHDEEYDLLANDERRERIKKQKEHSDKVREDLHHKISPLKGNDEKSGDESSPVKKNIHHSPSRHSVEHDMIMAPKLTNEENDESLLVSKLSPRSRSKHHKALASEHNSNKPHYDSSVVYSHEPSQRSRKQNNSSALKDMDGNLVFPNGVTNLEGNSYTQDYFNSNISGSSGMDPSVLITYCASDWMDKLKDTSSTALVDDELSRMLSDV